MGKIKFLKLLDKTVGKVFVGFFPASEKSIIVPEKIRKILFIRPGGIGDLVLLFPAISALAEFFPGAEIDLLCEKRNAGIAKRTKSVKNIYLYDRGLDIFKCMRNEYDVVIDTEQWHRLSAVTAYLTGAPIRIGYATNERKKLFTHPLPYSHDEYEVYSFFHLIEPLAGKTPSFDPDMPFLETPEGFPPGLSFLPQEKRNKLVAVFPGATVRERKWENSKFGRVAEELINKGYAVVILGSVADKRDAEAIRRRAGGCIDLTGKTTLEEAASVLKACKALLTSDSGLMHVAYAVGTPTVSLFGSGIEKKWAPRGKRHIAINKGPGCSPCTRFGYTPRCPRNVECLSSIKVPEVVEGLGKILGY